MNTRKAIQISCALVLGLAMYMPMARADVRDQKAWLTFDKPVQVSNTVILPAGSYTFSLADMLNYPNGTMQIFDRNGNFVTNVATEAASRPTGTAMPTRTDVNYDKFEKGELQLAEGSDHDTLIKYFYPGDTQGHKFIYSEQQEQQLSEEAMVDITIVPRNHAASEVLTANNDQ